MLESVRTFFLTEAEAQEYGWVIGRDGHIEDDENNLIQTVLSKGKWKAIDIYFGAFRFNHMIYYDNVS